MCVLFSGNIKSFEAHIIYSFQQSFILLFLLPLATLGCPVLPVLSPLPSSWVKHGQDHVKGVDVDVNLGFLVGHDWLRIQGSSRDAVHSAEDHLHCVAKDAYHNGLSNEIHDCLKAVRE